MNIIKQLFCKHTYSVMGTIPCTYVLNSKEYPTDVTFLECVLCKKRTTLMKDKFYYSKSILKLINLWKKHQLEIDFEKNKG